MTIKNKTNWQGQGWYAITRDLQGDRVVEPHELAFRYPSILYPHLYPGDLKYLTAKPDLYADRCDWV